MAGSADEVDLSLIMDPEKEQKAEALCLRAFKIWQSEFDELEQIDKYVNDVQNGPYTPKNANSEYNLLIKRSMTNMLKLVLRTPAQSLFAEGYRASSFSAAANGGAATPSTDETDPLTTPWGIWQRNGMDRRQSALFYDALKFGFAPCVVEWPGKGPKQTVNKRVYDYPRFSTLDPMRSVALYFDPANDDRPAVLWTLDVEPGGDKPGRGRMWDQEEWFQFEVDEEGNPSMKGSGPHGFADCPGIMLTARRDLQGRTEGIVKHLIPVQDRINQTVFDLLVAQSYGSFRVRYATGMVPPPQRVRTTVLVGDVRSIIPNDDPMKAAPDDAVYGYRMDVVVDDNGNPVPMAVSADISRFLVAEDPTTKFGDLPGTELGGFIESVGMSLSHLATLSQLPPHYLLGNLSNLSADALAVAESSLARMVAEFQHSFGEALEQVMGLFMEAIGQEPDYLAEMQWRDMSPRSFAAVVDGLTKMAESLGIPLKGLWAMVPGVTSGTLDTWQQLSDETRDNFEDTPEANMAHAAQLARANNTSVRAPSAATRRPASSDPGTEVGVSTVGS